LCNGECKDDKSAMSCGNMCSPCPMPANAKPTCKNGQCDFDCTSGRRCHDQCIGDTQPCDGNCPSGALLCRPKGICVPAGTIKAEECDGEDNDCNGRVDDLPAKACTSSPACGTQTCNGKSGWSTASCKPTNTTSSCGSSCQACPGAGDGGGRAVCSGGGCKVDCPNGRVQKGNDCVCASGYADCDGTCVKVENPVCVASSVVDQNDGPKTFCDVRNHQYKFNCNEQAQFCAKYGGIYLLYYQRYNFDSAGSRVDPQLKIYCCPQCHDGAAGCVAAPPATKPSCL
jgi:hypothetical protein